MSYENRYWFFSEEHKTEKPKTETSVLPKKRYRFPPRTHGTWDSFREKFFELIYQEHVDNPDLDKLGVQNDLLAQRYRAVTSAGKKLFDDVFDQRGTCVFEKFYARGKGEREKIIHNIFMKILNLEEFSTLKNANEELKKKIGYGDVEQDEISECEVVHLQNQEVDEEYELPETRSGSSKRQREQFAFEGEPEFKARKQNKSGDGDFDFDMINQEEPKGESVDFALSDLSGSWLEKLDFGLVSGSEKLSVDFNISDEEKALSIELPSLDGNNAGSMGQFFYPVVDLYGEDDDDKELADHLFNI